MDSSDLIKCMEKVVKVLVKNESGQILLLRRSERDSHAGYWETPGGGVEQGETLEEAALREVEEEAGLNVDGLIPYHVGRELLIDDESGEMCNVYFYELLVDSCNVLVDLSANPDHDEFTWVTEKEAFVRGIDSWTLAQLLVEV